MAVKGLLVLICLMLPVAGSDSVPIQVREALAFRAEKLKHFSVELETRLGMDFGGRRVINLREVHFFGNLGQFRRDSGDALEGRRRTPGNMIPRALFRADLLILPDLLKERGAGHIKIFGGGGGVILPEEIEQLHQYGITRLFSPDDGRKMGLQGMINEVLKLSDFPMGKDPDIRTEDIRKRDFKAIARTISAAENYPAGLKDLFDELRKGCPSLPKYLIR